MAVEKMPVRDLKAEAINRVKAKKDRSERQRKARGGRDLTSQESTAIVLMRSSIRAIEQEIEGVQEGKGVNRQVLQACFQLADKTFGSNEAT